MLRDFKVYRLAKVFYAQGKTVSLPLFLREQFLRASASVVLNIAEGSGRRTAAEQRRFYNIALSSLRECQAILEIEDVDRLDLRAVANEVGAILFKLSRIARTETELKL